MHCNVSGLKASYGTFQSRSLQQGQIFWPSNTEVPTYDAGGKFLPQLGPMISAQGAVSDPGRGRLDTIDQLGLQNYKNYISRTSTRNI